MFLAENQKKPAGVIVCFIPYQLDMKALRNEAAEHRQQTLQRKTWGSNQQKLPNFSRLTLLKNTYPSYLTLSSERKLFYLKVCLMASINQHLSLTALRGNVLCQPVTWVSRVVGVGS